MAFRKGGAGKKRDAAEPAIIEALKAVGAQTWQIGGRGLPDLLVRYRGIYTPLEVKTGKGRKTEAQADIPWPVVRTIEEALSVIECVHCPSGYRVIL